MCQGESNKGHRYLLQPVENYLVGIPIISRTKDGGNAYGALCGLPLRPLFF